MKKIFFTLVTVLFFGFYANAQNFINAYSNNNGGDNTGFMSRIATDNMHNVINTTTFNGPISVGNYNFSPNGTISSLIVTRDDNDSVVWAKSLSCVIMFLQVAYTPTCKRIFM